jgi:hypothetical protein
VSDFYEVLDIFNVDSEERLHRNHDLAFKTEAEARAWIDKQSSRRLHASGRTARTRQANTWKKLWPSSTAARILI